MVAETVSAPVQRIDRYQVRQLLGEGAAGRVYRAWDPKLERDVAIKVLASNASEELRRRFRLEAKAVAALRHPNIVELYDYSGPEAADLFLVMEWVQGKSLWNLVGRHGCMSEATALCIGHELALALTHAHDHNVVHRDLKPENVMLSAGRVVLTDFGSVKAVAAKNALGDPSFNQVTRSIGTPGFMAPEQFTGRGVNIQTDIFSLGATLYNLTTLRIPYEGGSVDAIYENLKTGRYQPPDRHRGLLSKEFCQLMAHCLAPQPKQRFASVGEVREKILQLMQAHGILEVRQELQRYLEHPAIRTVEQRERNVEALLRDLKVALKDRDNPRARAIVQRIQVLAPLDQRVNEVSGVSFDTRFIQKAVSMEKMRRSRRRWVMASGLLGILVGGLGHWMLQQHLPTLLAWVPSL